MKRPMNKPQTSHERIESDPWLDALLDDALSADRITMPVGLTGRIIAATEHQLPSRHGVLATIGSYSFIARYAATFLLIASLGATFFIVSNIGQQNRENELAQAQAAQQASLARLQQVEEDVMRFAQNAPVGNDPLLLVDAPVDQSIDQVKARLNSSEITSAVDTWDQMTESLEIELARLETESNG